MSHSHKVFLDDHMNARLRSRHMVAGPLLRYHQCNTSSP